MPLLDRMVKAGILRSWQGSERDIRLVWNPDFGARFGGEQAARGLALILRELDLPVSIRDLRELAGFVPPAPRSDRP